MSKEAVASVMDVKKVLSTVWPPYNVKLTNEELILYSLGIGFSSDPMNANDYKFTYENDGEFQAFATMPSVIAHRNPG